MPTVVLPGGCCCGNPAGPCPCPCPVGPLTWRLDLAGVTNGTCSKCDDMTPFPGGMGLHGINGTHTLWSTTGRGCMWGEYDGLDCVVPDNPGYQDIFFDLYFDNQVGIGHIPSCAWVLRVWRRVPDVGPFADPRDLARYGQSAENWNCLGPNTMNLLYEGELCRNWPGVIQLVPGA